MRSDPFLVYAPVARGVTREKVAAVLALAAAAVGDDGRVPGVTVAELLSHRSGSRDRVRVRARWAAMLALREAGMPYRVIGQRLGGLHYSTVMHGIEQGGALAEIGPLVAAMRAVLQLDDRVLSLRKLLALPDRH